MVDRKQIALESLWAALRNSSDPVRMPVDKGRAYRDIALASYSDEQVEQMCGIALGKCKFFPKPVELIGFISGSVDQRATYAWDRVLLAIRVCGSNIAPEFHDPAISRAIGNMGGWLSLLRRDWSRSEFIQKDFTTAYRSYDGCESPIRMVGHKNNLPRIAAKRSGDLLKLLL